MSSKMLEIQKDSESFNDPLSSLSDWEIIENSEIISEAKTESESEPKPESQPKPLYESEPESDSESEPESEHEPDPDSDSDPEVKLINKELNKIRKLKIKLFPHELMKRSDIEDFLSEKYENMSQKEKREMISKVVTEEYAAKRKYIEFMHRICGDIQPYIHFIDLFCIHEEIKKICMKNFYLNPKEEDKGLLKILRPRLDYQIRKAFYYFDKKNSKKDCGSSLFLKPLQEPTGAFKATIEAENSVIFKTFISLYISHMEKLCFGYHFEHFITRESLREIHKRIKRNYLGLFDTIEKIGEEEFFEIYKDKLEDGFDNAYKTFESKVRAGSFVIE